MDAAPLTPCEWFEDESGDYWITACEGPAGELWTFTDGGPIENHVRFCPYCGRPVAVVVNTAYAGEDEE